MEMNDVDKNITMKQIGTFDKIYILFIYITIIIIIIIINITITVMSP